MPAESGRVGRPGRVYQDKPLAPVAQFRQRREQQAQFTQPGLAGNQFADCAQRPPFTGQARVQPRVAGGQGALPPVGLAAFPQLGCGVE